MITYTHMMHKILTEGEVRDNRTDMAAIGLFGAQMRFRLGFGFPAVTTKRLAWRPVVAELLWFLEGSTDERRLAEIQYGTRDIANKTIWTANADAQGKELGYVNTDDTKELGPVYGSQWRAWGTDRYCGGIMPGVDQIQSLITNIKEDPFSRRHILNAWNVGDIPDMALPPCHLMAQFYVSNDKKLSCHLYQRSADFFLGVPFNIASYALLTHIIADLTGLQVGDFVHTFGDAHVYLNHIPQAEEQIARPTKTLPKLIMPSTFRTLDDVLDAKVDDFQLIGYNPHPAIKAPMAV